VAPDRQVHGATSMSRELTQAMDLIEHLEAAPSSELTAYLQARLQALLDHAGRHCPHYRRSLAAAGWAPGRALTSASWMRVPVLTRTALQEDADALRSESVPPVCGRTAWAASSGSTGRAVRVLGTEQQMGIWQAITVREHLEHRRDLSGRMAYIKVGGDSREHSGEGRDYPDWGPPVSLLHRTGPASALGIDASTAEQARWLAERDPHYLLTYPANLEGLVAALDEAGIALPALRQVRTLGEVVTDELRARVGERLGVTLADLYSAAEVGYVATQVPDTTHYRCRSEAVLVEVLRDDGGACAPGELGRVVITALYSFAMPLVRYEIGDFAVGMDRQLWAGAPRHLQRIVGRVRNLMRLPDGSRRWPRPGLRRMRAIAPFTQVQVVQTGLHALVLKLVCAEPLGAAQRDALVAHLKGRFDTIDEVTIQELDAIPRGAGLKFEAFRCEL
jgi:phenylacetate-CoA ligase